MLQALLQIPFFWVAIWTAPVDQMPQMFADYVTSTFIVLSPVYGLLLAPQLFGIKSKLFAAGLKRLFAANVLLALAPVAIPAYVAFTLGGWVYRRYMGHQIPVRQHRPQRQPLQLVDDEEEEEGAGH